MDHAIEIEVELTDVAEIVPGTAGMVVVEATDVLPLANEPLSALAAIVYVVFGVRFVKVRLVILPDEEAETSNEPVVTDKIVPGRFPFSPRFTVTDAANTRNSSASARSAKLC